MITVTDIRKCYGHITAVNGVTFSIGPGEIVGLIGPNGAGKTSLMRVLTGHHLPNSGSAVVAGYDVRRYPLAVKKQLGYLPENAPLYYEFTVTEYLHFMAQARGITRLDIQPAVKKSIAACGIESVAKKKIATLSQGFRQRVGIAQAILHQPAILILDEPTSGLDPNQLSEIRSLIKDIGRKKTIILSSHIMQEVEAVCDRVLIMNKGIVAAEGTPGEIGEHFHSSQRYKIELNTADLTAVETALRTLPDYAAHNIELITTDTICCLVTMKGKHTTKTTGAQIFEWAVRSGFSISMLQPVQIKLEDVFSAVTKEKQYRNDIQ